MLGALVSLCVSLWTTLMGGSVEFATRAPTPAEQVKLNAFFTTFSAARVGSFGRDAITDDALIGFATAHAYANRFQELKPTPDGEWALVPAALVDELTTQFFARRVKRHAKEAYPVLMADGEAWVFSQVTTLAHVSQTLERAEGVLYRTGGGGTPDLNGTPAAWAAADEWVERAGTFRAAFEWGEDRLILREYTVTWEEPPAAPDAQP